jgi:hypothetical protein
VLHPALQALVVLPRPLLPRLALLPRLPPVLLATTSPLLVVSSVPLSASQPSSKQLDLYAYHYYNQKMFIHISLS